MAHYRMTDKLPSAIITVNGNEKKIYEGNQVFLQNGDNFEIRFFNPLQEKIGVELLFNSQKKNDGLLVLRPGEDIILDRFLGEKKKMKFDIYTIDGGNSAAVKAAEINGLVEFKFYKEKVWNNFSTTISYSGNTNPYFDDTFSSDNIVYFSDNIVYNKSEIDYSNYTPESTVKSKGLPHYGSVRSSTATDQWDQITENKIETGRVEKGPKSSQEIKTIDAEFETKDFHTITYQMKPNSAKPTEVSEIRNYCSRCGYRLRKNSWLYCPKCGLKID